MLLLLSYVVCKQSRSCSLQIKGQEDHKVSSAIQFSKQGDFVGVGWDELCLTGIQAWYFLVKSQIMWEVGVKYERICVFLKQVEENVAAVTELESLGMDQETLSEVEAILEPVKNLTWPSGIHQN